MFIPLARWSQKSPRQVMLPWSPGCSLARGSDVSTRSGVFDRPIPGLEATRLPAVSVREKALMRSQPTIRVQSWGPTPAARRFPSLSPSQSRRPHVPDLSPGPASWTGWRPRRPRRWWSSARPPDTQDDPRHRAAERDRRPFVWLSIDRHDNDPAVLLTYLAMGWTGPSRSTQGVPCPGILGRLDHPHDPFRRSRPRCPARRSR